MSKLPSNAPSWKTVLENLNATGLIGVLGKNGYNFDEKADQKMYKLSDS